MRNNIYLSFLTLCVILFQEIGALSEESIGNSLRLQSRKKRVIDKTGDGNSIASLAEFPYVVQILVRTSEKEFECTGSIINEFVVVTAAHCVSEKSTVRIYTGTNMAFSGKGGNGTLHKVKQRRIYSEVHGTTSRNDFALIHLQSAIDLSRNSPNKAIPLYDADPDIPIGTLATIAGWGCCAKKKKRHQYPEELRKITVPIIDNCDCELHFPYEDISEKNICTYDNTKKKYAGSGDSGGPLVVHGKLVGVLSYSKRGGTGPDVYINLLYPPFKDWFLRNSDPNSAPVLCPNPPEASSSSRLYS